MTSNLVNTLILKIVHRAVLGLTPYPRNARRHSRAQIRLIMKSLKKYGFLSPIIIDADGVVLCGHGRLEAAILLGMETVPPIMIDHLDEAERRAYAPASPPVRRSTNARFARQVEWFVRVIMRELRRHRNKAPPLLFAVSAEDLSI